MKIYQLICKLVFILVFISCKSYAGELSPQKNLVTLGSDEAPVKIKIFSSLTCPHCADFHTKVLPSIKEKYVKSGKVQIIFVDFPLDKAGFNASKLLHCLNKKKQMNFLDEIYENQNQWTSGSDLNEINENLKKIVSDLGISTSRFEECLNNETISDKILNGRIDAQEKYSINSTPTIIINEKKLKGSASFKNIEKEIEKLI